MDFQSTELSLPRTINLGQFGTLRLAKPKKKCLFSTHPKYDRYFEKGWLRFGDMNIGKMTVTLPDLDGSFSKTIDLKGLDVTLTIKEGADLDDLSAYKEISIGGVGNGRQKVFKGGPVDFRYSYFGLNFAKIGDKAKLNQGKFVAELPIGEFKIPNSKFRLEIDDHPAQIHCDWKKTAKSWNDGRWDTKGLESARLVYWLKGAALMTGQIKSSKRSGISVKLKLQKDWGPLPKNEEGLRDIEANFISPNEDDPWNIEFT